MSEKNAESGGFPESQSDKDLMKERRHHHHLSRTRSKDAKKTSFVWCFRVRFGFVIRGKKCKEAETDIPYDFDHRNPKTPSGSHLSSGERTLLSWFEPAAEAAPAAVARASIHRTATRRACVRRSRGAHEFRSARAGDRPWSRAPRFPLARIARRAASRIRANQRPRWTPPPCRGARRSR